MTTMKLNPFYYLISHQGWNTKKVSTLEHPLIYKYLISRTMPNKIRLKDDHKFDINYH